MKTLYESILSSTGSGKSAIAETIYNKLLKWEKLTLKELKWTNTNIGVFKVNKEQLTDLINNLKIYNISLNWLDVSDITDMSYTFAHSYFNADISKWDVSNVKNMSYMFERSQFNSDMSKWDVSKVENMNSMFYLSDFNNDISKLIINKNCNTFNMFSNCPIKNKYKQKNTKI